MSIPLDQVMSTAVSSLVPSAVDGQPVVVDENAHATTSSSDTQNATLAALDEAVRGATTAAQRAGLQHAMEKFGAAMRLRTIAQDPAKVQALEYAANGGDANAAATLQGIAVMRLSDLKRAAREIAAGVQHGNVSAFVQAQNVAQTAATPNHPAQKEAIALQSMIQQVQNPNALPPPAGATIPTFVPGPGQPSTIPTPTVIPTPTTIPTPSVVPVVPGVPTTPSTSSTTPSVPTPGIPTTASTTPATPLVGLPCDPSEMVQYDAFKAMSELEALMSVPHSHGFPFNQSC